MHRSTALFLSLFLLFPLAVQAQEPQGALLEGTDFFEKQIRPMLVDNCLECHGAKKQSGSLRLDSRENVLRGGDNGPAIVAGDPEKSRLIAAVRREGDLQMPPESKLTPQQVAALAQWVKIGAPWPRGDSSLIPHPSSLPHWAFQPIRDPPVPSLRSSEAIANPIDAFVQAKLQSAGLNASPPADPRTFIRRATYDLTGLPPTPEEVTAFEQSAIRNRGTHDSGSSAIEDLIDRLLASPHYGEQWGRHWLDVARYSDTKGYVYAREERFWVHAWAYRDWVVRALQRRPAVRPLPAAADRGRPGGPRTIRASLAAMGFLTLGRRFLGVTHDIIDDRIDVVTRGTMGLTVACARCHDHKYDPIPTRDYYSLYGVFQNCRERVHADRRAAGARRSLSDVRTGTARAAEEAGRCHWPRPTRSGPLARAAASPITCSPSSSCTSIRRKASTRSSRRTTSSRPSCGSWQAYLTQAAERRDPVFAAWHAYAESRRDEFASAGRAK